MAVQASPAALPALTEFWGSFPGRCRRPEGTPALARYLTGRLTERPTKHGDTMAEAVPGSNDQRLQECLTNRPWDAQDLTHQRGVKLLAAATLGHGVWVRDDPGLPTQGQASVGVARPDSGTVGKVGHGQIAVTCGYPDLQASGPVAVRLSLPPPWVEAPERRQPARVPAEMPFQTTPEIARALLDPARAWEVPPRGVVADAADGANPNLLAGMESRQEGSGVGVRTDLRVRAGRASTSPVRRADTRRQRVPRWPWRTSRWRPGTNGGRRQQCMAGRGGRVTAAGQRPVGWRVGERATRGQPEERQDHWSHLAATATLEELAG